MQAPPPAPLQPTAQGSFAKTPFPHLLVYALERALSGTFELHVGAASVASILVIQGVPAKVRTTEGVLFLGDVMQELGLVSAEAVKASQERMAESPRLQGQILLELGAVDEARLDAGLRAQLERKLEHLFTLPSDTVFSYYDGVDSLQRFGGPPTPIDPLPALWRGVRQVPAWEHVDATLRRVGSAAVRIASNAQLDRFQFTRAEAGALELLSQRPMRVVDLANAKVVGPSAAQLLVYLLVITKQVDLVETPSMRPAASPGSPPPSGVQPGPAPAAPGSTGRLPAMSAQGQGQGGASGQAFARVQLQAKPIQRAPLVVEEASVARSASDGRIASPIPQPIPLPDYASPIVPPAPAAPTITGMTEETPQGLAAMGLDIGSMISNTIQSSMPPPMPAPEQEAPASMAPPPESERSAAPLRTSSQQMAAVAAPLTSEQSGLKQKILERAAQISAQDYFQMLGLERDASAEMVQKAFFGLAKVWHPDRLPPALVDVKDACSRVFTHLTEAQATLLDPERKAQYMTLLKDGGATPDDQAKIQAILEAATEFQKAEILLKRNDTAQAFELAKKAHALDPEQADYLAMVTWLDAQRPEWIGREKTLEKIAVLDRCIKMNANSERAYFWRGMLYKRIDETNKALKDFKKAGELNPRNLDAMREVRLHNIRGGQSKPPPGGGGSRPSGKPPAQPETLGGLFGKLFKK
ncbi:MAG TPA: DnaJ domain-containing protein [Labilithrix sp.]|nr:DnaJ domain-containing protein [Labilithrix sp.]